ncbi:cytochrome P450 [Serendipita vermifera]|nr:cytochrome P450 [Serendipita vermifera]
MNVEDITAKIVESSLKACAVSVGVASLGYLTVKGVQALFSNHHGKRVYPPGPPRGPLIGAMRSFPKGHFAKAFSEWAVTYGDIVYAPLPGMEIVILNSVEVAQELLNKKRNTTARRQVGYLVMNLMGWHWALSLVQPGIHHSNQRKYLRRAIGAQGIASHEARIEAEVTKLMPILSTFEGNPNDHMQQCIGHMVSKATYGEQIWREIGKDLARWNIEAMDIIGESLFSFWLVDVFHFLRFIPDWVPGLRFKQIIKEGNDLAEKVRYRVYNRGLELHQAGKLEHCILRELLEVYGPNVDVQDATATLYTGMFSPIDNRRNHSIHFLLIFVPDIAQRVYEEIQSVTHGARLPHIADRQQLPYTEAVYKEAARWKAFFPLGFPHVNEQDEIVNGYFIPKGTMIHQNFNMMLNNPKVWGDPEVFRPERFLEPGASEKPNPLVVIFGWGTRVCPGIYFADRMVFHMVTTINSLFKIEPLEGCQIPDPDTIEYTPRSIQQPIGFKCRFVLRDEKAQNLLKEISRSQ